MLSIIIPARNSHDLTTACLSSVLHTVNALGIGEDVEYVLIDDCSDPEHEIGAVFDAFKANCGAECTAERLPKWSHYTGSFRRGMELAIGSNLFLLSNDMQVTPNFLRTLLAVAALNPKAGVVRGTSRHCDSHPQYNTKPPIYPRNYTEVCQFSRYVADFNGLVYKTDPILSGDAVLIKRDLVDAIGIFDPRFFGYFGDVDYGVRARRAGFSLVCALGAWLHHEGAGHVKQDMQTSGKDEKQARSERLALVEADYQRFRDKWGLDLPVTYDPGKYLHDFIDFDALVKRGEVFA